MGWFNTLRSEIAFSGNQVSHIQQIETMNTRLEKARGLVAEGRVFPARNKKRQYVVFAPQEKRFYIVNAEGCCTDRQRGIDLLEDYCEHRLAVDLFNKAQEAKGQSQPLGGLKEVEATSSGVEPPLFTKLVANGHNGKAQVAL